MHQSEDTTIKLITIIITIINKNEYSWLILLYAKALLQLTNFTLGTDATLNTETHTNSVRIKVPNSVNASKRKHKNQINHYNKQKPMANSTVCKSK